MPKNIMSPSLVRRVISQCISRRHFSPRRQSYDKNMKCARTVVKIITATISAALTRLMFYVTFSSLGETDFGRLLMSLLRCSREYRVRMRDLFITSSSERIRAVCRLVDRVRTGCFIFVCSFLFSRLRVVCTGYRFSFPANKRKRWRRG